MSKLAIAAWSLGAFGVATFLIVGGVIIYMVRKDKKKSE